MSAALGRNANRMRSFAPDATGSAGAEDEADIGALIARLTAEVN